MSFSRYCTELVKVMEVVEKVVQEFMVQEKYYPVLPDVYNSGGDRFKVLYEFLHRFSVANREVLAARERTGRKKSKFKPSV